MTTLYAFLRSHFWWETRVSKRTIQRSLYQEGYNRRVVKKKVRIREVNRKKCVKWAREKLHWRIEGQWERVIFSDESQGLTSPLVSISSSKRWRPVWGLFSTDPLRLKRTTTSETVPLWIFKVSAISCSLWPLLRISTITFLMSTQQILSHSFYD
jgi:hypothetical protein